MPAGVARTFEASYRIPYIAHVPLEPRAAVAEWQDGKVTVWTGTQRPFGVRTELAEAFRIPEDRVRVIVPDMGSGVWRQAHRRGRRSRRRAWRRPPTAGEAGVDARGGIRVGLLPARGRHRHQERRRCRRAASSRGPTTTGTPGSSGIQTPYDIALKPTVFHASKTPLRQGSYRALAATANHYAREMHMDEMARALGVDAVEFRMHAPEGRAHARRAERRRAEDRLAEAVRRRAVAGHRVRHREGGLRRDGGRGLADRAPASRSSASSSPSSAARS